MFYVVATLLLAAPLPWHVFSTVARAVRPDVWLNVWALSWTSEHLLTAPATLFDANIFFPHAHTLAYTDHFIGEALIAAPAYWATGSATLAYNLAWFAALVLTGWGGYLWVRCLMGDQPADEAAALVAGAVCLLVPGKGTAMSHLQVISLQGVTLALFATHMLLQKPGWRRALALAAAAVYAALCSWYTAAYTALLLPLVGLAGIFGVGRPSQRRRATAFGAGALLLAVIVMYPVALPYRAVQQEMAFERTMEELVATSLRPLDFVASWSWLHRAWLPEGSGAGGYFPGLLAMLLAALGVRDGWRRGDRWPVLYAGGAVGFAVLALGPRLAITEGFTLPLPVGYGARWVIEWGRARLLYRQRWRARPQLGGLVSANLGDGGGAGGSAPSRSLAGTAGDRPLADATFRRLRMGSAAVTRCGGAGMAVAAPHRLQRALPALDHRALDAFGERAQRPLPSGLYGAVQRRGEVSRAAFPGVRQGALSGALRGSPLRARRRG